MRGAGVGGVPRVNGVAAGGVLGVADGLELDARGHLVTGRVDRADDELLV